MVPFNRSFWAAMEQQLLVLVDNVPSITATSHYRLSSTSLTTASPLTSVTGTSTSHNYGLGNTPAQVVSVKLPPALRWLLLSVFLMHAPVAPAAFGSISTTIKSTTSTTSSNTNTSSSSASLIQMPLDISDGGIISDIDNNMHRSGTSWTEVGTLYILCFSSNKMYIFHKKVEEPHVVLHVFDVYIHVRGL